MTVQYIFFSEKNSGDKTIEMYIVQTYVNWMLHKDEHWSNRGNIEKCEDGQSFS